LESFQLIPGYATPQGTARFRDRFQARWPGHFRQANGLWLSSIGLGTYLGEPNAQYDARYREAVTLALESGLNVIDSAVNYRHMRSERAIGAALRHLISSGRLQRDEVFIATKGGFLTFDGEEPADPAAYFQQQLLDTGLVEPGQVVAGCHVLSPRYLEHQVEVSRQNLGLETIDLYYVHNPETQLAAVSRDEFYRRLGAAFAVLEQAVQRGRIRAYGIATWNALRVPAESQEAVSLERVFQAAQAAAGRGNEHHFRAVQLPFNLAMPEAFSARTQVLNSQAASTLQAAEAHGCMVFSSATLLQGQLASGLPPELQRCFSGLETDAQRAIQFVRSAPGVTAALVGMSDRRHVEENLSTAARPPLSAQQFQSLFSR
jgi:aryl-alcohol dehydrogenase-like predicted oxidoreductase